ncbi:MAG: sterol desaturase family protein [Bdellovibrionota bacterium]
MHLQPGKNIRLFQHPFLERCTYVHPALPLAIWGPVILGSVAYPLYGQAVTKLQALAWFFLGLLFWSLAEYVLHRYVFHFKPKGKFQERVSFLIHGIHHEDPEDARRLLMPPLAGILIALPFYALFLAAFGVMIGHLFFAGFITGYLCYDYTHFAVHFMRPKSKFFKTLKQNHMMHHFVTQNRRYGVSSTFWDHVFGTRG